MSLQNCAKRLVQQAVELRSADNVEADKRIQSRLR